MSTQAEDLTDDPVNPYRSRAQRFPGRIFELDINESERTKLISLVSESPGCFVELGSGSGKHLLQLAKTNPQKNCFGFELRYKRAVRTIEKGERDAIANAFVVRGNARLMAELFPPRSIDGIFVNFPDPWAKPKQWKHRLLSPWLLDVANTVLTEGGCISVKTDHEEMFGTFLDFVEQDSRYRVVTRTEDLARCPREEVHIMTEFETLFRSQGLPIRYARLARG